MNINTLVGPGKFFIRDSITSRHVATYRTVQKNKKIKYSVEKRTQQMWFNNMSTHEEKGRFFY